MKKNLTKLAMALVVIMFGFQAFAQGRIELNAAKSAQQCTNETTEGFSATFSFASIEAYDVTTERGVFSNIEMDNTYSSGNIGEPNLPAANKLIAVPVGATDVKVEVKGYTTEVYNLADYGISQICPMQPKLRKDQKPEDIPFEFKAEAYARRGFAERPIAQFEIQGTMRGIQVGALTINPVQYDAVNNLIRVYNNIEVEVNFGNYDKDAAYNEFARTFSPYFAGVYQSMFNERALRDVYDDHPDMWQNPVKMLVITNRAFESTIADWVTWKTEKGFYVDVNYTDEIGSNASAIKTFIQQKFAADAPTFLMIMGDKNMVPESANGSETHCVTDLQYSSVDGDMFSDMYHSRFPAEDASQMTAMLNKALEYEQLTMPDPSYLSNVLLIAGEDSGWGVTVGRPTIWYATNYYYNTAHGFANVYEYSHGTYTGCYSNLNTGVGFVNYTAHGSNTSWAGPSFTVSDVNNLTNEHKYFLAMGNCCEAADWGISGTCFGEAMVRAANKAAYAYIGSCPSTYWLNDYYFGVGATSRADGTMPSYEETTMGCYDAIWTEGAYNVVDAIRFVGNLASNAAEALGYTLHCSNLYDWQAYHTLGDGSILPYRVEPTEQSVTHLPTLPIGMNFYTVTAEPGSYVGISKDGVLYGAGMIDETGTTNIDITPVTSGGMAKIVVTHPQHVPYIAEIPAAAMTGPYLAIDSYTPNTAPCNEAQQMTLVFKNVGADATTATTNVVLTSADENITITDGTGSFGPLAADATATLTNEFSFIVAAGVPDKTKIQVDYTATCGSETWEGHMNITVTAPVIEYNGMQWSGSFEPGDTKTVSVFFNNTGHYQATNAVVTASTTSSYASIVNNTFNVGTIAVGESGTASFDITINESCPESEVIPLTFTLTADNGVTAEGESVMSNTCIVVFSLHDSYGDGWNGCALNVQFSDGTPAQNLTISTGNEAVYNIEIAIGTTVTVSFVEGSWAQETSFEIAYEDGFQLYASSGTPSAGVVTQFVVNCNGAMYDVTAVANPAGYGTVTGAGSYMEGFTCTLQAIPGSAYEFVNWTRDNVVVSEDPVYSFMVTENVELVANFAPFSGVVIGDGTETNQYLPSYNYYKFGFSEQIYTAEEIGMPGIITSVAFYNGGAEKTRTYDMYIVNTNKSSFSGTSDWIAVSSADLVFSGSVNMTADSWITMNLTTPFVYDGTQNIALVMDDNTGSYTTSPHMACRVFNASGNQALYYYNDNTNVDPTSPSETGTTANVKNQLRLGMQPIGDMYHITVAANPVAGGNVTGGGYFAANATRTITATANTGYTFVNWTKGNAVVSTNASYTFTVTEDADFVANFELISYTITATANPTEGGEVDGGGSYNHGASCTLTATANSGFTFVKWTRGNTVVSTNPTYTFTVTQAGDYVAHFSGDGVDEIGEMTVVMYPNPASEKVIFETSEAVRRCEVYNINGALVYSMTECSENFEINVSDFAAGSYIVRLVSDNSVQTRRFTKK